MQTTTPALTLQLLAAVQRSVVVVVYMRSVGGVMYVGAVGVLVRACMVQVRWWV